MHLTTCSERLRLWYTSVLRPRRVGLTLVLADVYKATWDDELHPTETERKVMSPDCPLMAYLISSDELHPTETERKVMSPDCPLMAYLISSDGL